MSVEPSYVNDLRRTIPLVDIDARGWTEGWAAPVSLFHAPSGFGEEIWELTQSQTLLAWRLRGAHVFSELSRAIGRSTQGRYVFNLQVAGMQQRYRAPSDTSFCHFYITDQMVERVAEGLDCPEFGLSSLRDDLILAEDRELRRLLDNYAQRSRDGGHQPSRIELEARALLIVEHLVTRHHLGRHTNPARGGLAPWQVNRTCEAMRAQLDTDLGLDDLATIAGCSPTHFSRAFKQSMGLAPFHWLQEQRIEKAKELLADNRLSLAEIALAVGFSAQPQFTTAFGRATGRTPGAWRRARLS